MQIFRSSANIHETGLQTGFSQPVETHYAFDSTRDLDNPNSLILHTSIMQKLVDPKGEYNVNIATLFESDKARWMETDYFQSMAKELEIEVMRAYNEKTGSTKNNFTLRPISVAELRDRVVSLLR